MSQLETFRLRLEQLKEQGVDIDPEKVTEEIIETHTKMIEDANEEEQKLALEKKRKELFELTKSRTIGLINDFRDHYQAKGRKLKVIIRVEKENSADAYGEKFVYDDDMQIISMIEIGTKGKYEKAIEEV